jgi:transcriptional regulator of heat shock response
MNVALSDRQIKLLEAIIREYSESSEPVGSKTVVRKYAMKVSPATIRNEMAALLEDGFLEMMHTSSGRVPTSRAFRFFIEELMEEDELPVLQEVAVKQRLWPQRFEFEKLLRNAVLSLSEITKNLALAITEDGFVTHAGAVHMLDNSEFWDIEVAKATLELVDKFDELDRIFKAIPQDGDINVAVGDEISYPNMEQSALVFSPFRSGSKAGFIAVLGPSRMKYSFVLPSVRYTRNLLQELGSSW